MFSHKRRTTVIYECQTAQQREMENKCNRPKREIKIDLQLKFSSLNVRPYTLLPPVPCSTIRHLYHYKGTIAAVTKRKTFSNTDVRNKQYNLNFWMRHIYMQKRATSSWYIQEEFYMFRSETIIPNPYIKPMMISK